MHLLFLLIWLLAAFATLTMVVRALWCGVVWLSLGLRARLAGSPELARRGSQQAPHGACRVLLTDRESERRWAAVRGERERVTRAATSAIPAASQC
jgi:hypothetical protein